MTDQKVRENRLRRAAARQGLKISRSRRRDPRATDYAGYMLVTLDTNTVVAGGGPPAYSMTLDDIEERLNAGLSTDD